MSEIFSATVSAPTNIACIKYWGKASIPLNTPINDSVSVTLHQKDLKAVTTASCSTSFKEDKLWLNGIPVSLEGNKRFYSCLNGVRALAKEKGKFDGMKVHVSSYNTFPTAAGLASSAAGYAALTFAFKELFDAKEDYEGQLSTIARQGSGSACRSLYGGFVAWRKGNDPYNNGEDSMAVQIAPESHWPEIRALILVVSDKKKDTSSTKGMSTSVATSKLLAHRADSIVAKRMEDIEKAYLRKDFESFGKITMMDSNQFHATCLDTYPPIFYMNDISKGVIQLIHKYNEFCGEIRAAYTFDAGPNAVLYTLEKYQIEILALVLHCYPCSDKSAFVSNSNLAEEARAFKLSDELVDLVAVNHASVGDVKVVYCTESGPGPLRLDDKESLIDLVTGDNLYNS